MPFPNDQWRHPTSWERSILDRLMTGNFQGAEEVRKQIAGAMVSSLDDFGSISIRTTANAKANVRARVPIEAYANDIDGNRIHYLLHVVDGLVNELEVYTDTTECPMRHPDVTELTLQINE